MSVGSTPLMNRLLGIPVSATREVRAAQPEVVRGSVNGANAFHLES